MSRSVLAAAAVACSVSLAAVAAPAAAAAPAPGVAVATASAASTTPRAAKPPVPTADVSTGPTRWVGQLVRHPRGGRFYPNVLRWANLALAVMHEHGISPRYLPGVLAQIQQESSGNPNAVNRWDSNAAAGHPSKGLLQVIAPTYRAYAKPGYTSVRYQTVPYTNLWAAMNYVLDRYGKRKFKLWSRGHNQGY